MKPIPASIQKGPASYSPFSKNTPSPAKPKMMPTTSKNMEIAAGLHGGNRRDRGRLGGAGNPKVASLATVSSNSASSLVKSKSSATGSLVRVFTLDLSSVTLALLLALLAPTGAALLLLDEETGVPAPPPFRWRNFVRSSSTWLEGPPPLLLPPASVLLAVDLLAGLVAGCGCIVLSGAGSSVSR